MHVTRHLSIYSAALSLLLITGCGTSTTNDGAGGGGGGGGGTIAVENLSAAFITGWCDMQSRCSVKSPGLGFYSTKAVCVAAMTASLGGQLEPVGDVLAGKLIYDGKQAISCLDYLKTTPCGELNLEEIPACQATFSGALADGVSCADASHCTSGWCEGLNQPAQDCPGTCAPAKADGEACKSGDDAECADALVCRSQVCGADTRAKAGESCDQMACEANLLCVNSDQGSGVCEVKGDVGGACKSGDDCKSGLRCAAGTCAVPGKAGETCDLGQVMEGASECEAGLNCGAVMEDGKEPVMTCMASKKVGEACKAVFECSGLDLYCKAGTCAKLPAIGETCASQLDSPVAQCDYTGGCDKKTDKCAKAVKPAEGDACPNFNCGEGLQCVNDKCEKKVAPVCK